MAEPTPTNIAEGVDPNAPQDENPKPLRGDSAKAAAALSALDSRNAGPTTEVSQADQKALGEAMSRLELLDGGASTPAVEQKSVKEDKSQEVKKKVKIDPADVALLVGECEVSKATATEMLRGVEGDVIKALSVWVKA